MRESKSLALPLGDTPVWKGMRDRDTPDPSFLFVGWVKGLEPSTPGTTIRCSNQLSYTHHIFSRRLPRKELGTPEGTRTPGLLLRRQLLYPTELLAHKKVERVTGIEPASPAWKAGALAIVLHPHAPSAKSSALSYYHILLGSVKRKIEIFRHQKIPGKILEHLLQTRIFCDIIKKNTR